ncbi:MAG: AraC family transcriptional regulator, partial [Oscillospiraceae bacterium]|nr:AraC family transcriptional regulator [Oscillospiraceae bacterium]
MISLTQKYRPVLSAPFGREGYREIAPCDAMKPYIRCFWTEKRTDKSVLVIPDTCMDIIFKISENGETDDFFCALDERSFYSANGDTELFGVRFYAWTAQLFSRRDFSGSGGGAFLTGEYFDGASELRLLISSAGTAEERAAAAEHWLLARLENICANNDLLNAADLIIESSGRAKIADICSHTAVSPRQIERIFNQTMGISPKCFSGLVRYQMLWREMALSGDFNLLDAVE